MNASLLPNSSSLFEKAMESALAPRWDAFGDAVATIRTAKLVSPPPSFLPYLVHEYGLGELTPYVPNLYTLIVGREGINWQRVRGTPAAVEKGLGWLGYAAEMEDAWAGRTYWNSTQLHFSTLPVADHPDLERIEGVVMLSLPKRSQLRRGVYQYDVRALVSDRSRADGSLFDWSSGIDVTQQGTLWSFGRTTEVEHVLTEAEGMAIGNWIAIPEVEGLQWSTMQYPWVTATFSWAANAATQRRALMAAWFEGRALYATLRRSDGEIIGHRRCRAVWPSMQQFNGCYSFAGVSYQPMTGATRVYIEAMTDFGDAADVTAESIELTIGAARGAGVPAGRLWLQPGELTGGHAIASIPVSLPLRATVREQLKFLMRF
ncbi:phage tail protein [Rhizobium etli 8C-3]|uniref:Phage tail protein n=1 Tax=Rhizobium etli 8C-3 TaxID=538025 RepID=A0A1L5P7N9_RHIET|nr:phage tail protein [Rhizobium etli]APO76113.1 phage tail protein [Rhizobium etli 8C-3]